MLDHAEAKEKKKTLIRQLEGLDSLVVAFSGGVDSSFLLAVAHQVLGEKVLAATASSKTYPLKEQEEAVEFTRKRGIPHIVFPSDECSLPQFLSNSPDRCYHCKKSLSEELRAVAHKKGFPHIAHAANLDDLGDYRPGLRAASEMGIIAPLVDARLTKEEIRFLSKEMGLPTWDKPAMACLASRFPYGEPITEEKLRMVEEAEAILSKEGFRQFRVRYHGSVARIEVEPSEIERMTQDPLRRKIAEKLRGIGFLHVAVDLEGYVSGSLNRALKK
ncbi:MAG: ATP-dependent sacrificial sulfur transferase LarE [Proteobacteria bacterium]|nr:ATP-dependent sacrificial sulfur transferase LarE [Pseudomonadota bacterium]